MSRDRIHSLPGTSSSPPGRTDPWDPLDRWALSRKLPFTFAEAWAVVRNECPAAGSEADAHAHLAEHESIVRRGERFFTPRILAASLRFRIRLLPYELEEKMLIAGHRFLPFMPLAGDPGRIVVRSTTGATLIPFGAPVEKSIPAMTHSLFSSGLGQEKIGFGPEVRVRAFSLICFSKPDGRVAPEWVAACHDFDSMTYMIAPAGTTPAEVREQDAKKLRCAFEAVTGPGWEGPLNARRQLLAAVADCWESPAPAPVGPLGPALGEHPTVNLTRAGDEAILVRVEAGVVTETVTVPSGTAFTSQRLIEILQHELLSYSAHARQWSAYYRGRVGHPTWNQERARYEAPVRETGGEVLLVQIFLDPKAATARAECSCGEGGRNEGCFHCVGAVERLIQEIRNGRRDFEDLGRTPAELMLKRLDAALAVRTEESNQRLVWRISLDEEGCSATPYAQKRNKAGGWTAGRQFGRYQLEFAEQPWITHRDRMLAKTGMRSEYEEDGLSSLELMVDHPRLFDDVDPRRPVTVQEARLGLKIERGTDGAFRIRLTADDLVAGSDGVVAYAGEERVVFHSRSAGRIVLGRGSSAAMALARGALESRAEIPPEAVESVIARLPALEAVLPVELPDEWAGVERPADARLHLQLTPDSDSGLNAALCVRPLPAPAAAQPPGEGPGQMRGMAEGARVRARRDLSSEAARARALVLELGLDRHPESSPWVRRIADDEAALDFVVSLQAAPREDLVVEWPEDGRVMKATRPANAADLRVEITQGKDWFGLEGSIQVDGETVALLAVLEALRNGRRYVPIAGGKWLRIEDELRARLTTVAQVAHGHPSRPELGPTAVPLVAELVREAGTLKACAAWRALSKRFHAAMDLAPEPPTEFTADLREYQLEGYRWMRRLAEWGVGGCLADDMGLGKTIQALGVLVARAAEGPALVVAPVSVGTNWLRETRRFAPGLNPLLYRETDRAAEQAFGPNDLVIASYGLVLRDVKRLEAQRWHTLILDEAQFVKNSQTKTAQAVRRIPADWRFALTGTPVENHLGDLWSLFRAVSPGLFGGWEQFRDRFAGPIEREKNAARREMLARVVRPFILRRTKGEVLRELPPRTEIRLSAELSPAERKLYEGTRLEAIANLATPAAGKGEDKRFQVLAALTKLRQLACHPRLVYPDLPGSSAKLQLLMDTVEELREEGHRALVFSQFVRHLDLVRAELDAKGIRYQYLDGATPPRKRDEAVAAFQGGEGELFLISLKAGGTGLNLTGADYVIHLDPWWNPAVEDQATDRAHRIGQTRPVIVYRLVAADTIEEQILALHADKRDLVAGVLDGTDQAGKLSTADLIALIQSPR